MSVRRLGYIVFSLVVVAVLLFVIRALDVLYDTVPIFIAISLIAVIITVPAFWLSHLKKIKNNDFAWNMTWWYVVSTAVSAFAVSVLSGIEIQFYVSWSWKTFVAPAIYAAVGVLYIGLKAIPTKRLL